MKNYSIRHHNRTDPVGKVAEESSLKAVALILVVGVGLRIVQCFGGAEMWYDELAVIRNVKDRGWVDLVSRPLDHFQVAPVGFLAYQKLTVDGGEKAERLAESGGR